MTQLPSFELEFALRMLCVVESMSVAASGALGSSALLAWTHARQHGAGLLEDAGDLGRGRLQEADAAWP